ncbi:hypothetical protein ACFFX0_03550 [Citricoccus parietis]|uniref:Pentapeptide repeat-containing protein n=1 Tax=Citricoccus parietis TaxID=592307 RepID=A0ABV5FUF3_9MICC
MVSGGEHPAVRGGDDRSHERIGTSGPAQGLRHGQGQGLLGTGNCGAGNLGAGNLGAGNLGAGDLAASNDAVRRAHGTRTVGSGMTVSTSGFSFALACTQTKKPTRVKAP